jgi:hypothetical protein
MNTTQLIDLAQRAWNERPTILGLPGGDLSPEEMAGELIRLHGLDSARAIAVEQDRSLPAAWSYQYQVCRVLDEVSDDG